MAGALNFCEFCDPMPASDDASPDRLALPPDALLTLSAWLSPAYPVGGYTYSHGLEWAIEAGDVASLATLTAWLEDCLRLGAGRSDAILLAAAWRAESAAAAERLAEIAELASALTPSVERRLETMAQGAAFLRATRAVWPEAASLPAEAAYPVAVGAAAARLGVPLDATALLFLQAFAANLISAAVRLIPLGQTDGQRALAALAPTLRSVAEEALAADLDALGGCVFRADIASMKHETQYTRLFRS